MIDMIKQEELPAAMQDASDFDTDATVIGSIGAMITAAIARHYATSSATLFSSASEKEIDRILGADAPKNASLPEEVAEKLMAEVMPQLFNAQQPQIYQLMSSPLPILALFETITTYLNAQPYGVMGARVQTIVLEWLGRLTGFAPKAAGIFTKGGTASNLYALAVARIDCLGVQFRKKGAAGLPALIAYVSEEGHACLDKAIELMGIGSDNLRKIAVRPDFTIDTLQLEQQIKMDLANGDQPFCIIANGGGARTGSVDPVNELADIAATFNLWLHIDGAYGALAALTPEGRRLFAGIERADSISLDPHKWMSVPYESSCLLVREGKLLEDAFENVPDYLGMSRSDSARAFSRHFDFTQSDKALKVWLAFQLYGVDNYTRLFESHLQMAASLAAILKEHSDFQLYHQPQLSICCFRYLPNDLKEKAGSQSFYINNLNRAIELSLKEKNILITTAVIRGETVLRVCFLSHRVKFSQVAPLVAMIEAAGKAFDRKARNIA